jgi:uncharacterized membrane protein
LGESSTARRGFGQARASAKALNRMKGSPMNDVASEESSSQFERIVFFSDAVFAIVITVLVLPLTAEIHLPPTGGFAALLSSQWPAIATFAISFFVIGRFWVAHHRMFGFLNRYNDMLTWCNLVCLFTVCFIPYPSALLLAHPLGNQRAPVAFYAASMTAASIALTGTWLYASRTAHLLDPKAEPQQLHDFTVRSLATSGTFVLSIGVAYVAGLLGALLCWLVLLPVVRRVMTYLSRRRS